ncbi:MAG: hypothetical protein Q9168_007665 [Polycauliona sp. 1 TL-2023]
MHFISTTIGIAIFLSTIAAAAPVPPTDLGPSVGSPRPKTLNPAVIDGNPYIEPHIPIVNNYPPTTTPHSKRNNDNHGPFMVVTLTTPSVPAPTKLSTRSDGRPYYFYRGHPITNPHDPIPPVAARDNSDINHGKLQPQHFDDDNKILPPATATKPLISREIVRPKGVPKWWHAMPPKGGIWKRDDNNDINYGKLQAHHHHDNDANGPPPYFILPLPVNPNMGNLPVAPLHKGRPIENPHYPIPPVEAAR